MSGNVHAVFGAFIGYGLAGHTGRNELETLGMVGVAIIGALAPDIDTMNSKISRKLPLLSFLASAAFGHRKLLHTPFFIICIWCCLRNNMYVSVFCLAYGGHILQDTLTKEGVPLLYPVCNKRISLLPFRSGSEFDYITTFALIAIVVYLSTGMDFLKFIF